MYFKVLRDDKKEGGHMFQKGINMNETELFFYR